jgi:hypothetical protein
MKDEYRFEEGKHRHFLNDKQLTGCTTVLGIVSKPALIQWSSDTACKYVKDNLKDLKNLDQVLEEARVAHTKVKEKAGGVGTKTHAWIEDFVKGKKPKRDSEIEHMVKPFVKWWKDNDVKLLESERNVYSKEWFVGGIADLVVRIGDKVYVGDIKTGAKIYEVAFAQAGAYAKMLIEMGLYEKIDGVFIANCSKTGKFDVQFTYGVEPLIEMFKHCLEMYRFVEKYKKLT